MIQIVGPWQGICAVCGEPVAGYADPHTDATVPAPGPGVAAVCLLCALGVDAGREAPVLTESAFQGKIGA